MTDTNVPSAAIVPVVSAWASKINWAQIISLAATLAAIWNINVSPEFQALMVTAILGFCAFIDVLTVIFRTWYSSKVVAQSIPKEVPMVVVPAPPIPQSLVGLVSPKPSGAADLRPLC